MEEDANSVQKAVESIVRAAASKLGQAYAPLKAPTGLCK